MAFCFHGLCPNGAAFADLTYGFYPVFAGMFGIPYHVVPLRGDFTLAVEDYEGRRETVFLANPNAPTGLYLAPDRIRALLEQDRDRLVVVDEAYIDFGGESAVALLSGYDNLLVVQTFSKSRQLAGGRLGLALGSRELIADLNTLKFSFNPYSVNNLTLLEGAAAMQDRAYFDACRREIIRVRTYTIAELRRRGFSVPESLANFILPRRPVSRDGNIMKNCARGVSSCAISRAAHGASCTDHHRPRGTDERPACGHGRNTGGGVS